MDPRTFRVFVSSPGDVAPERERATRVMAKLDAEFGDEATFELVRWEDSFYSAAANFQSQTPRPSECHAPDALSPLSELTVRELVARRLANLTATAGRAPR